MRNMESYVETMFSNFTIPIMKLPSFNADLGKVDDVQSVLKTPVSQNFLKVLLAVSKSTDASKVAQVKLSCLTHSQ